ncbi:phage baseplate assembly protein V [Aeromonas salmonicida]|uniref:phage baseplate assembly protein V n=1 Tax=Aeromonas salmonicida TaxID=645 RepID=UPI00232B8306|nr:phage baseplate assembly protein V [Aeromonas salmonicida]WCH25157.1 phage baseplate assembly protein V [Aeromonas salmonicida]
MSDERKLLGSHRSIVTNVDHPLGHYKVQIRVLGLWDDMRNEDLPWAEPKLELGTRANMGGTVPCEVGDLVWVEFDHGDTRCPIITGGCLYAPDGVLNMPHEAFAGSLAHQHKRSDKQPKPEAATYHRNAVYSLHGILIELTKESALRFTHKASGSAVELTSEGQIVLHGEKEIYQSSAGDTLQEVGGALKVIVKGNAQLETEGDYSVKAGGNMSFEAGGSYSFKGTSAAWTLS